MSNSDGQNERSSQDIQQHSRQPLTARQPGTRRLSSGPVELVRRHLPLGLPRELIILSSSPRGDAINIMIIDGSATLAVGFRARDYTSFSR